jgi:hypothetical protein
MPVDTVANALAAERELGAASGSAREQLIRDILNDMKAGTPAQKEVVAAIDFSMRHADGTAETTERYILGYLENVRVHNRLDVPHYPIRSDLSPDDRYPEPEEGGRRRRRKTRRGKKVRRTRKSRR